eukprot:1548297-Pleurochrysis_carterae.AAC.1
MARAGARASVRLRVRANVDATCPCIWFKIEREVMQARMPAWGCHREGQQARPRIWHAAWSCMRNVLMQWCE